MIVCLWRERLELAQQTGALRHSLERSDGGGQVRIDFKKRFQARGL